jgi:hypothetical protein
LGRYAKTRFFILILLYYFLKSVYGYLTMPCVKFIQLRQLHSFVCFSSDFRHLKSELKPRTNLRKKDFVVLKNFKENVVFPIYNTPLHKKPGSALQLSLPWIFSNMSTLSSLFVVLTRLRGSKVKIDQGLDVEKLDFKIFEHSALLNEDFFNIGCKRKK